jgi:uncharacterized protein YbjT (DUF2867 family)
MPAEKKTAPKRAKASPGSKKTPHGPEEKSAHPRLIRACGFLLLQRLLDNDRYGEVTAVVRSELPVRHPKLRQAVIDFDGMERSAKEFAADDVFCCLGSTIKKAGSQEVFSRVDHDYPLRAAALARKKGAKQFIIITAMGANARSRIFYNRVKGEIEADLADIGFEALRIVRPSLLLGKREEKRFGESVMIKLAPAMAFLLIGPLRKYRPISADAVAKAMVSIAEEPLSGIVIYESNRLQEIAGMK